MLYGITFNMSKSGEDIIQKMAKNILEKDISILDLRSYQLKDISFKNIYLIFGNKAENIFLEKTKGEVFPFVVFLPDLEKLENRVENEEIRSQVWKQLVDLKEQIKDIKDDLVINEDILSLMSSNNILILENIFRETKQKYWIGRTKDNKVVKLIVEKEEQEGQEKVDICLTFKELYGIKVAQETLGVHELRIIYH
jgi:hypothetical protein